MPQDDIVTADVGGAQPYWTEFEYDEVGNRTSMVEHGVGSTATATSVYTVGTGGASPHQLVEVAKTTAGSTTTTEFDYDAAGNRVERTSGADTTTYLWDAEGELAADDDYEYIYDASGNRIVRTGADATTVYLPGGQEVTIDGTTVTAARYYSFGGMTVATRTGNGLGAVTTLVSDRDGSVIAAVPNTEWSTASLTRVYTDPFGSIRGNTDTDVPGDHRFLGATRDADSGLTMLGARYYDPVIGCFISVDPILNLNVPAHLHAYAYGFNNPVTFSDASGLEPKDKNGNYDGNYRNLGGSTASAPPSTSWAALGGCADVWCGIEWANSFSLNYSGGIAEVLWGTFWGTCGACQAGSSVAQLVGMFTNPEAYWAQKDAEAATFNEFWTDPWHNFWRPIGEDWANNPGHALGATVAIAGTTAIPGGGLVKAGGAVGKLGTFADDAVGAVACVANSFTPETKVLMADGSTEPIEQIDLGDEVWAADPETGEAGARPVTALIEGAGMKDLVTVSTSAGSVVATAGHPFWNAADSAWVDAGDLTVGDEVLDPDGATTVVTAVSEESRPATVHNLTVEGIHTYFVMVGDAATLVHNCGARIPFGPAPQKVSTTLDRIDAVGAPFPNTAGGKVWRNDSSALPAQAPDGVQLIYREWDLDPKVQGVNRNADRLVTGSDGSAYFTTDHYTSFVQIRGSTQ